MSAGVYEGKGGTQGVCAGVCEGRVRWLEDTSLHDRTPEQHSLPSQLARALFSKGVARSPLGRSAVGKRSCVWVLFHSMGRDGVWHGV